MRLPVLPRAKGRISVVARAHRHDTSWHTLYTNLPPPPVRLLFRITIISYPLSSLPPRPSPPLRRALILNSPFFLRCRCNYAENRSPIRRSALRRRSMLILEHKRARASARALRRTRCTHSSFLFFSFFFPFSPFFCFIEAGELRARGR